MSLLMDALKKAEEEKKQAAKRLKEVEMDPRETSGKNELIDKEQKLVKESFSDISELSLEPVSMADSVEEIKEAIVDENSHSNQQEENTDVDTTKTLSEELTLENTVLEEIRSQEAFEQTQKESDPKETAIVQSVSADSAATSFEDTVHDLVSEGEKQEAKVYQETLRDVHAEQLTEEPAVAEYRPTPVAAQTVFSVGQADTKRRFLKWGMFVVLALLVIVAFSVFYYFTVTPVSRTLPAPIIAHAIESNGVENKAILPEIPSTVELEATQTQVEPVIQEQQTQFTETLVEPAIKSDSAVKEDSVAKAQQQAKQQKNDQAPSAIDKTAKAVVSKSSSAKEMSDNDAKHANNSVVLDETDELRAEILPLGSTEHIQIDKSLINISKSKKKQNKNVMISQAFKAYQKGHYAVAKSIYDNVLKNEPDNRNAHLGLGAIFIIEQDRKKAYSHYAYLLKLNPLDTLAMAALIGLSDSADPIKDESAIKLLIKRDGDVPYLYFSLGNLYAKQKRWANAQQAFFDAYRLDTTNLDYALNLAISLDHNGQYDTALDYYKTAIDLSKNSSSRFDPVPIKQRIDILSKLIESRS